MTGKTVDVLLACLTPPKRTTGLLLRNPVALVTQEKYGADTAQTRRIFLLFGLLLP